jgi:amidase
MLPVADGSDHAGSLRNPAAYNNLFGFRPSPGRVPSPKGDLFSLSLSVLGPIARTVPDLAMLLGVMAGYDARHPASLPEDPDLTTPRLERDMKGLRIGWFGDFGGHLALEQGILDLCGEALRALEGLGCVVEEARPDASVEEMFQNWRVLRGWAVAASYGALYADPEKRRMMKPEAVYDIEAGLRLGGTEINDALVVRSQWYDALRRLFERYDVLALPSAQVFPFDKMMHWPREIAGRQMDTYHRWMEVMIPATMGGLPALSVPVGFDGRGRPMGMQIIGPNRAELLCMQVAHAYDRATGWVARRPPSLFAS